MTKRKLIITSSIIVLIVVVVSIVIWRSRQESFVYREPTIEELTREVEEYRKGEEELQQFKAINPFVQYLPYREVSFEVHYKVGGPTGTEATYKVILKPQADRLNQSKYKEEINQLTLIVREWIKSKGFDPDKLPIEWTTASPQHL